MQKQRRNNKAHRWSTHIKFLTISNFFYTNSGNLKSLSSFLYPKCRINKLSSNSLSIVRELIDMLSVQSSYFDDLFYNTLGRYQNMEFRVPESLELEHEELHRQLVDAINEGGNVGEAASAVAKVLHPHFEKEKNMHCHP